MANYGNKLITLHGSLLLLYLFDIQPRNGDNHWYGILLITGNYSGKITNNYRTSKVYQTYHDLVT